MCLKAHHYYFISALLSLGLFITGISYYSARTMPFAKVGDLRLGGLTKTELIEHLTSYEQDPLINLKLPDQEYLTSLTGLGFTIDKEALWQSLRFPKISKARSAANNSLLVSESKSNLIIPEQAAAVSRISYDREQGALVVESSPKQYEINPGDLEPNLITQIGQSTISLEPGYLLENQVGSSVQAYNDDLHRVFSNDLVIKIKEGTTFTNLNLGRDLLKRIVIPINTDHASNLTLNKDLLLANIKLALTDKQKEYYNSEATYQNVLAEVNSRFHGAGMGYVLGVDDGPSSTGTLAPRYLEVDLSQQKMYFFIDNQLYKSYNISTGGEYPTPVGEFKILNKAPKAFSAIYNVWMPYWMAITYANDIGAYIGIHEIAYAVNDHNIPFYKHGYYIGTKMTGGCVAMEPKDSREIYNLSQVGMLVRVVQ